MAYPRLIDDANTVIITGTKSVKQTLTLEGGSKKSIWKSQPVTIASIPVTQSIADVEGLDPSKAAEIQAWLDVQMDQIAKAYQRNYDKGIYGGLPVIKRYKTDAEKWGDHPDYIPGRRTGEFLGIIKNTKSFDELEATDESTEFDAEWAGSARKDIYGLGIQAFHRLLEIIPDSEFTDEEVSQIVVYSQTLPKFVSNLQDERFRVRAAERGSSNPEEAKQRKAVVEANVTRNKAESDRLMHTFGIS